MAKFNVYSRKLTRYLGFLMLGIVVAFAIIIQKIGEKEETLRQVTLENKLLEQQLPLLSGIDEELTGSAAMWKDLLPVEAAPIVWESQILALALSSGISISEINVADPVALDQHRVYTMKVNFSGDFFKVLSFFESIEEKMPLYIVNIEKMYSKNGQIHGIVVVKNNVF